MSQSEKVWVELIPQEKYDFSEILDKLRVIFKTRKLGVDNKTIMLKVSFVFPAKDRERTKMIITNPILIAATCQALLELNAKRVYIADGETIGPARYAYKMVEISKEIKRLPKNMRKKVTNCYLDEAYKEWVTPENPLLKNTKLDYPKIAKDVDILISMPKLKVNVFANITLSVKNGMGFIKTKTRWDHHKDDLHDLIADIYQIRPPDYVLTDAIFAGEGQGPMEARPYPMNLILFGNNGLAVDSLCCNLMGVDPFSIKHLKMLYEHKFGPLELDKIEFNEEIFKKHIHEFKMPKRLDSVDAPNFHYYEGKACESGCPAFLRAFMDAYIMNLGAESLGEIHIITGKNPPISKEELKKIKKRNIVVYGNCAKEYKKYGRFYKGCPPNYFYAMLTIQFFVSKVPLSPWLKYVSVWNYGVTYIQHWLSLLRGKRWKSIK